MNRRSFFRRAVPGAFIGAAAATAVAPASSLPEADHGMHGEWTLRWLGWQRHMYNDILYSAWTAAHPDGSRYYSTVYNVVASYHPGEVFNYIMRGVDPIHADASDAVKQQRRLAAYEALIAELDNPSTIRGG
jgi:hypothetical protein